MAGMAGTDARLPAVVIDCGTGYTKMGYAGNSSPNYIGARESERELVVESTHATVQTGASRIQRGWVGRYVGGGGVRQRRGGVGCADRQSVPRGAQPARVRGAVCPVLPRVRKASDPGSRAKKPSLAGRLALAQSGSGHWLGLGVRKDGDRAGGRGRARRGDGRAVPVMHACARRLAWPPCCPALSRRDVLGKT